VVTLWALKTEVVLRAILAVSAGNAGLTCVQRCHIQKTRRKEVRTVKHICETCKFNSGFTVPPSPGGNDDGVNCTSKAMAFQQDAVLEYQKHGAVNLWRVERVVPIEEACCDHWELGMVMCPQCGSALQLDATYSYAIGWDEEQDRYTKDIGSVEYVCGNCRAEIGRDDIDEILKAVDEL
jgi:hypothetical protein